MKFFLLVLILPSCSVSDYTQNIGNDYLFISESNTIQFITGPNDSTGTGLVPCTVEEFVYDDFHIIAKQRDNPDCLRVNLTVLPFNYWIIDKKSKKVHGPLDSLAFNRAKIELSVSNSLDLK